MGGALACMIVDEWIETPFEGGRHGRRVDMIRRVENGEPASESTC